MNELKKVKNDLKEREKKLSPFLDSFLKHKELQKQESENQSNNSENTEAVEQEPINVNPQEEKTENKPEETLVLNESEENNETATPETQTEDEVEEETPLEGNVETKEEKESTEKQANEEKAKLEKEQKIKEVENEILSISLKMPFGESIEKNEELYEKMKRETIPEFAPLVEFAYKQLENLKRMGELKSELEQIKEPETKIIQDSKNGDTKSVKNKILNIFNKKESENTETPTGIPKENTPNIPHYEETTTPEKTEKKKLITRFFGFMKNNFGNIFKKNKKEQENGETNTKTAEQKNNEKIWGEIKNGNYANVKKLTRINLEIAEIFSKSKKGLPLENLKQITLDEAELLARHKGYIKTRDNIAKLINSKK